MLNLAPAVMVERTCELDTLCAKLGQRKTLVLDTEFVRTRTFFPTLGLIQTCLDNQAYLIDPLAVEDLSSFTSLLAEREVTKVFHSCSEDLETLYYLCGFVPGPVFDTQIAASFLGFGPQASLQSLVKEVLGKDLPKGETRSNWLKRPLTESQIAYAAQDVLDLPRLYEHLTGALAGRQREAWAAEEFAALENETRFEIDPSKAYLRLGSLWQYNARELAALQGLCAVREKAAMTRDLPRGFIMTDQVIRALVRARPRTRKELAHVEGIRPGEIRRSGKEILAVFEQARAAPPEELPTPPQRPVNSRRAAQVLSQLRTVVEAKGEELGLPPEMLARKRDLTELVQGLLRKQEDPLPKALDGWRRKAIGERVLAEAKKLLQPAGPRQA